MGSSTSRRYDTGNRITRLTAWAELGIAELSARIIDLTNAGYPVERRRVTVVNRWGEKVSVMEYWKRTERKKRDWKPIKQQLCTQI